MQCFLTSWITLLVDTVPPFLLVFLLFHNSHVIIAGVAWKSDFNFGQHLACRRALITCFTCINDILIPTAPKNVFQTLLVVGLVKNMCSNFSSRGCWQHQYLDMNIYHCLFHKSLVANLCLHSLHKKKDILNGKPLIHMFLNSWWGFALCLRICRVLPIVNLPDDVGIQYGLS